MENNANYAECNAEFIDDFLRRIGATSRYVDINNFNNIPTSAGLYMFFVKPGPDSKFTYPIYVGYTTRSFQQRFREHATNGVIYEFTNRGFPRNCRNLSLHAYFVQLYGCTAKFIESVLLEAFDFCLNREENPPVRLILDTSDRFTYYQTKDTFNHSFQTNFNKVKDIYDLHRQF